jgi:tRNA nucleotidyltransferase/poly(A) polymerase
MSGSTDRDVTSLAAAVCRTAQELGVDAYLVGGCVRDQLLGRPTRDLDVLVQGDTAAFAEALAHRLGGSFFELGTGRGMYRVIGPPDELDTHVDLTPFCGPLEEDLRRRDFTINGLAKPCRTPGEVLDPTGGLPDIQGRLVRAASPESIAADPIRAIRAVRLAAQLRFDIEPGTRSLVAASAGLVARAPAERLRDELFLLLREPGVADAIRLLEELSLLDAILPEVGALREVDQSGYHQHDALAHTLETVKALEMVIRAPQGLSPEHVAELKRHWGAELAGGRRRRELLLLAGLLHDVGKAETRTVAPDGVTHFFGHPEAGARLTATIARRLTLSRREEAFLKAVVAHHLRPTLLAADPNAGPAATRRLLRDGGDSLPDIVALSWADGVAKAGPKVSSEVRERLRALCRDLIAAWSTRREQPTPPLLSSAEIMEMLGVRPGPQLGALIRALADAQADGVVRSREGAAAFLRDLLDSEGVGQRGD